MCCPKGFHSLQSQHCVTVPETGHTTTCRSSPSLLTQCSHKQVETIKNFWKDKRQISLCRRSAITYCIKSIDEMHRRRHHIVSCLSFFSCCGVHRDITSREGVKVHPCCSHPLHQRHPNVILDVWLKAQNASLRKGHQCHIQHPA